MTIQAHDCPIRTRSRRQHTAEYRLYFALLLTVLLPVTLVRRVISLFTGGPSTESVLREAVSEAHTAASMIFSA